MAGTQICRASRIAAFGGRAPTASGKGRRRHRPGLRCPDRSPGRGAGAWRPGRGPGGEGSGRFLPERVLPPGVRRAHARWRAPIPAIPSITQIPGRPSSAAMPASIPSSCASSGSRPVKLPISRGRLRAAATNSTRTSPARLSASASSPAVSLRAVRLTPLQVTDRPWAQACCLGQLFLRQAGLGPKLPEQPGETRRGLRHRFQPPSPGCPAHAVRPLSLERHEVAVPVMPAGLLVIIRAGGSSGSGGWRRGPQQRPRRAGHRGSSIRTRCAGRTGRAGPR